MESTRQTQQRHSVTLAMIGNLDETPWWVEPAGDYTVDERGARPVAGKERERVTAVLT